MNVHYFDLDLKTWVPVTSDTPMPVTGTVSFVSGSGDDTTTTGVTEETPLPVEQKGAFVATQETLWESILAELRRLRHGFEIEYGRDFTDPG